jgi:hypothetical protein
MTWSRALPLWGSRMSWMSRPVDQDDLGRLGPRLDRLRLMTQADQVLGIPGLAGDAAAALGNHEGLETLIAQAPQDVDGRDVRVALRAAGVLVGREDRGCDVAHLVFAQRAVAAEGPHGAGEPAGQVRLGDT